MNGNIKIVQSLEKSDLKGVSKTINNEANNKKEDFFMC